MINDPLENGSYGGDVAEVYFKSLTTKEIDFYIDNYQPFDKAVTISIIQF
ncbi:Maf family protein [bacterium]|nr:Maf family protein [bacterium]